MLRRKLNFHSAVLKCEKIPQLFVPLWKPICRIRSLLQLMPGNTPVSEPASQSDGLSCWTKGAASQLTENPTTLILMLVFISNPGQMKTWNFSSELSLRVDGDHRLFLLPHLQRCWSHLCLQLVSHVLHRFGRRVQRQQLTEVVLQHTLDLHARTHV